MARTIIKNCCIFCDARSFCNFKFKSLECKDLIEQLEQNRRFLESRQKPVNEQKTKLKWQDLTMSLTNFMFTVSLIYQIICNFNQQIIGLSWFTIISSTIGFYVIFVCLFTSKLKLSALAVLTNAICWSLFLFQKFIY